MVERLDQSIFLFINSLHNPFWDNVMWIISARLTWLPLYIAILVTLGVRYRNRMLLIFPIIVVSVAVTDLVSVQLFKEIFERLRPCHEPALEGMVHIVRGKCGGMYGFVSSHAANSFTIAVVTSLLIKKKWFTFSMVFWALLVGYSRVYLGVHYPGDVLGGSLLGLLAGYVFYLLYKLLGRRLYHRVDSNQLTDADL